MPKEEKEDVEKKGAIVEGDVSINKPSETSNEFKFGVTRLEYSRTSFESVMTPSTNLVLKSPLVK